MPVIQIHCWDSADRVARDKMARAVVDAATTHLGCPAGSVTVLFDPVPRADWYSGTDVLPGIDPRRRDEL